MRKGMNHDSVSGENVYRVSKGCYEEDDGWGKGRTDGSDTSGYCIECGSIIPLSNDEPY